MSPQHGGPQRAGRESPDGVFGWRNWLVDRFARHTHESSYFATVCGISVGVASLNEATKEADDVLYAADQALYVAKQRGKGCAVAGGTG
jgi:GGDEF domain-containing protein